MDHGYRLGAAQDFELAEDAQALICFNSGFADAMIGPSLLVAFPGREKRVNLHFRAGRGL
jgi:hypothetical protein